MRQMRALANRVLDVLVVPGAFAWLTGLALVERVRTGLRRRKAKSPRLVWGPVPLLNNKYFSEAMRRRGFTSVTCVSGNSAIAARDDFDLYLSEFERDGLLSVRLPVYRFFAWAMRHGDVFIRSFDGGFLRPTPLRWLEAPLLRLAGKKLIVYPYGSDIAVAGHLGELEEPLFADYPILKQRSEETRRWVHHSLRWANVAIRNWQFGYLPGGDVAWPTQLAIDVKQWTDHNRSQHQRTAPDSEVKVLHAPNHRHIKGTEHLERAIAELREEGLPVRLEIVERRPNQEIREAIAECDIVADQFLAGYALFALEGMSMGKPVLANLDSMPADLRAMEAMRECPIVDTDPEGLLDDLRDLVVDEERRKELGRAGHEFVVRRHSYEATAEGWEAILGHVWRGEELARELRPQTSGG